MSEKRAEALIDMDKIRQNYRKVVSLADGVKVISVVKAEAYGHGAVEVCRALSEEGCGMFAVACLDEGRELRNAGIKGDILILGHTPPEQIKTVSELSMTQTAGTVEYARNISDTGYPISIHIKIDTGMSRLGIYCRKPEDTAKAVDDIQSIVNMNGITCKGIFTHFACADDTSEKAVAFTDAQYKSFVGVCDEAKKRGIDVGMRHCANSGGILFHKDKHLDGVRAGIILYGLMPDGTESRELMPAMKLVSRVIQVSHIKKGDTVSYGASFTAERDMTVAAVSIGYADGILRCLSGKSDIVIKGKRAPTVGRICMDICMADVTEIEKTVGIDEGDEAEIFGETVTANELARLAGTINYEILCSVRNRVPRRYI